VILSSRASGGLARRSAWIFSIPAAASPIQSCHPAVHKAASESKASVIAASLVGASTPMVFVAAETLGVRGTELPSFFDERRDIMEKLEAIRRAGSVAMAITSDLAAAAVVQGVPKVALVARSQAYQMLSGTIMVETDHDVLVRAVSMGQLHRAVPLTSAFCTAVAAALEGTLVAERRRAASLPDNGLRIGHPSGELSVAARTEATSAGPPGSSAYPSSGRVVASCRAKFWSSLSQSASRTPFRNEARLGRCERSQENTQRLERVPIAWHRCL
jgi:2-methylaconitate cis-trans-isomerase PrpF